MNSLAIATLVKSSLLIGIAFGVNRLLLRRRSAASRHLVWTLALCGVLLLPLLSTAVPGWEIPIHVAAAAPAPQAIPAPVLDTAAEPISAAEPVAPVIGPVVETPTGFEPLAAPAPLMKVSGSGATIAIYAIGVLLLGLKLARDRWTLRRLVGQSSEVADPSWRELLHDCEIQMGVTHPVRLLRSLDRSMPMAFGVRTPTILIPAIADTWSEDRRRAVLLHELAHIDRRDCLTQLIASLTCAAYWMHPGVWWVARRLRVEREIACDDRVLAAGTGARDYAGHLLELAYSLGGYRAPALVVSMARPRQLEGRMLAVLDAARNRVTPTLRARVIALLATMALVLPLAAAEAIVIADSSEEPRMAAAVEPAPAPAPQAAPRASEKAQPAAVPSEGKSGERRRREIQLPGTWEARLSDEPNRVYLRLSERRNSNHGFDIALDQLEGLSSSMLSGGGGDAKFSIRREAGAIAFEGSFRSGVGAGTFDFTPNPAFPAEMAKRGFASPTTTEQYLLARGNIGIAFLDELNAQKYEKPDLDDLVRAADHGVHLEYLRGMGAAGYQLGKLSALIRTRDHGVTPEYARTMADEGFKNLTAEELVRARDHGVDPRYVKVMNALGYTGLKLDELIRARDHGVSEDYIRGMMGVSPERLSLPELVRARDHGVTPEYVKAMRDAGYGDASIQDLVRARDHGVSGDFAKGMLSLGLVRPGLEELVNARDHGVSPEYVKGWLDLGYKPSLAEMVRARDHGVEAEFAKSMNALGYERLTINELVRLRDHGVSASFVREQNATPQGKLSVDELVRRRDRM